MTASLPLWAPQNPAAVAAGVTSPRPHQLEDVPALAGLLADSGSRTTYLAACGTGKTLTALWTTQALDADTVIVGLPSLALISQTMRRWSEAADPARPLDMMALASSAPGDLRPEDCFRSATTDVATATDFWTRPRVAGSRRVLFVCYRSVDKLEAMYRRKDVPPAALLVCDEAHHLAGAIGKDAQSLLHDGLIPADRRLLQTATALFAPVTADPTEEEALKPRRSQGFLGMDQKEYWGEMKVSRGFRWAIDNGVLTDYDLVTPPPLDNALAAMVRRYEDAESTRDAPRMPPGYWGKAFLMARELGSANGAERVFSFHNKVADARHFAAAVRLASRALGFPPVFTAALSGADNPARREARLDRFRQGRRGLVSSVNVLNEGVDAPSVDGVAFIDQKTSVIYMVQGIGRAIRTDAARPDKRARLIVPIPVFPGMGEGQKRRAMVEGGFQVLLGVLEALGECDERIAAHARAVRLARAARVAPPAESCAFFEKFLAQKNAEALSPAEHADVAARLEEFAVERFASTFEDHIRACEDYARVNGDALCPASTLWQGLNIGDFLSRQRQRFKSARGSTDRVAARERVRLERLPGWTLDLDTAFWRKQALALAEWMELNGNSMPLSSSEDSVERDLGVWAKNQRAGRQAALGVNKKRTPLSQERYTFLRRVCPNFEFSEDLEKAAIERTRQTSVRKAMAIIRSLAPDEPIPQDLIPWAAEAQRMMAPKKKVKPQAPLRADTMAELEVWTRRYEGLVAWIKKHGRAPAAQGFVDQERDMAGWLRMESYRLTPAAGARPLTFHQRFLLAGVLQDLENHVPSAPKRSVA